MDGGAQFYAGSFTKAIGFNNEGWIYTNAPGYIYGFGPDTILCKGDVLNTFNFNGGLSYLWHDGSTESFHEIDSTGLYWVEVTYGENCIYKDSIYIDVISNAFVDAGPDIYVCHANEIKSVKVNIKDGISPFKIEWIPSNGVSEPNGVNVTIASESSRQYLIKVESANGCSVYDTLWYYVVQEMKPKITFDGVFLRSNYNKGNQWYIDGELLIGESNDYILPIKSGNYSVIIIDSNGCQSQVSEPYFFEANSINKCLLVIDKKEAFAGEKIIMNINVINKKLLLKNGINKLIFKIQFNPTLLAPLNFKSQIINDKLAYFSLDTIFLTSQDDGILTSINFVSGLGNSQSCDISISNLELFGGSSDVTVSNGKFTLLGICEEGGSRLINPAKITKLMQISPNPSDGNVNVELNLVEKGISILKVYSVSGKLIEERMFTNQTGNLNIKLNTINYGNGLYFIHLQTPTMNKIEKLIIYR